jgi:5'-methylthioadenosine phosphorylase
MDAIKIGLIGGSGLGEVLSGNLDCARHVVETPFGAPSGPVLESTWEGVPVLMLSRHGPGHVLNPSQVPYRANIFALKRLGCTHVIATGAVGSLREEIRPRDLVVPDQVLDRTSRRAGTFYERAAVHVEFAEPFCPVLRKVLLEAAKGLEGMKVHGAGTYVCMEGPAFSTRAESLAHRLLGGDVIGMTAMPEAKLAREAELPYALIALATDYDCWKARPESGAMESVLGEIIGNLKAASDNALALVRGAVGAISSNPAALGECAASSSLKYAIWSKKEKIARDEVARLRPLWGRYFV